MSKREPGMDLEENNMGERLLQTSKHGEYTLSAQDLSDICILDNHYKVPGKDMILSSQMIMSEQFGGIDGIVKKLHTNVNTGIDGTAQDQVERQNFYGMNSFPPPKIKGMMELILENFEDPINKVLCGAAIVSLIIGLIQHGFPDGMLEGTSILIALNIIVIVNSGNNYLSEKRLAELVSLSDEQEVRVYRNSEEPKTIDSKLLVVGDIVQFKVGEKVPADMILISGQEVECTETELTGEPDANEKIPVTADNIKEGVTSTMMAKSLVTKGNGRALVVAVGRNTVAGVITEKTQQAPEPTLLQRKLGTIADKIGQLGLFVSGLCLLAMILRMILEFCDALPCNCQNIMTCEAEAACVPLNFKFSSNIEVNGVEEKNDYRLYGDLLMAIIISITVVVVAIPEGLPLAVTISLSVSSGQMQKLNNLVRKLASSETMGGATHICSDKTGTLTQNKMTVMAVSICNQVHQAGDIARVELASEVQATGEQTMFGGESAWKILTEGILWNSPDTQFEKNEDPKKNGTTDPYILTGNVTEQGMFKFFGWLMTPQGVLDTQKQGQTLQESSKGIVSFTSVRKRASYVIRRPEMEGTDQEIRVYCKGAPDQILQDTTKMLCADGEIRDINDTTSVPQVLLNNGEDAETTEDTHRNMFERTIKLFAAQAYRTILVTFRDMSYEQYQNLMADNNNFDKEGDRTVLEKDLTAVGLFGIQDPLRDGIKESILKCRKAGITTIMCTGDNIDTAIAISKNAGIVTDEEIARSRYACMTGKEFREAVGGLKKIQDPMSDKADAQIDAVADMRAFRDIKTHLKVLARSSPEDKYILVLGIQTCEGVVAVTGDGTNDAPALTKADVGFAMGITGTDVAKGACDIILLDDNFTSIVVALKYGRNVYDNVRKFIQFQLTVNVVAMAIVFFGSLILKETPLNAVQMLWVNLIMDTFAALALATEAPYDSILDRQPYKKSDPICTEQMWRNVFGHAFYQAVAIFTVIFAGQYIGLSERYETSCWSTDDFVPEVTETNKETDEVTVITTGYCKKFNPFYAKKFYIEDDDIKFWQKAYTLDEDNKDAESVKDQRRTLTFEDFEQDALTRFMCAQYLLKNGEKVAKSLEDNAKLNRDNKDNKKPETYVCDRDYLVANVGEDKFHTVMPAEAEKDSNTQKLLLFTFVFQSFVMMQVFNQFNARKLEGEFNVFQGMFRNALFVSITLLTLVLQCIMVQYGGHMLKCQALTFREHIICAIIGSGELVWGLGIKFLPLSWFQIVSLDEKPMQDGKKTIVSSMKKSSVIPQRK